MSRRLGTDEGFGRYYDFGLGVVGNTTEYTRRPRYLKKSTNLLGRPAGVMGSVRAGSREAQNSQLPGEPTTIGKLIPLSGLNRLLAHSKGPTAGSGVVASIVPGSPGYIVEAAPSGFTFTDKAWVCDQLNATLFCTQRRDTQKPLMYQRYTGSGAYVLDNMKLVVPTLTPTATLQASATGVDEGRHWWRIRYLYRNGASKATSAFPAGGRDVTTGNRQVQIGGLLDTAITTPGAQDWVAWVIERTKIQTVTFGHYTGTLGTDALPDDRAQWYTVAQGTAATYNDIKLDADLFEYVDDGLFGDPPHLEGLIAYRDRLVGWSGSNVYVSQAVSDRYGTGPCNWDADNTFPIGQDDGDAIQTIVRQSDRLLAFKGFSTHPFEGDDPENFRTFEIPNGEGAVGFRAAASFGARVVALAPTGLQIIAGDRAEPWGEQEVGHYLAEINPAAVANVKAINVRGEFFMLWYPARDSLVNDEIILFDFRTRQFRHLAGWRAQDALVQKDGDGDFAGAKLLFADPSQSTPVSGFDANPSFLSWNDQRAANTQVFAQSLDSNGEERWTAGGIQVSSSTTGPLTLQSDIISDGQGGCIVAYQDRRNGTRLDIYAMRLQSDGTAAPGWPAGGVLVCDAANDKQRPRIVSDGAAGCVVIWQDRRSGGGSDYQLFGQRISAGGAVQWAANGVQLFTDAGYTADLFTYGVSVLPDFAGGAYILFPAEGGGNRRVKAQHVKPDGTLDWGATAVTIHTVAGSPTLNIGTVVLDGAGGVIVCYMISGLTRVNRVNASGAVQWGATGVNLSTASTSTTNPSCVADGAGGAIVVWDDARSTNRAIYGQRVNSAGAIQWTAGGVILSANTPSGSTIMTAPVVNQDGAGGCIIAWSRSAGSSRDVYAQKVNASGAPQWGTELLVGSSTNDQTDPALATDGAAGAIIVWRDDRSGTSDLYAQRVLTAGTEAWDSGGEAIITETNAQNTPALAFTNTARGGYPAALVGAYRLWAGFEGTQDEVLADGSGGIPIDFLAETIMLDDGRPDDVKDLQRLLVNAEGDVVNFTATLTVENTETGEQVVVAVQLDAESSGTILGDETAVIGPNDLQIANEDGSSTGIVGRDTLASEGPLPLESGLPLGTAGHRYKLALESQASGASMIAGFTLDGILLPERRY